VKAPRLHIDDDFIRIVNGQGRTGSVVLLVIGVGIALLTLLPPQSRGTDTPLLAYFLGAFLVACAAFWCTASPARPRRPALPAHVAGGRVQQRRASRGGSRLPPPCHSVALVPRPD